MKYNVLFHAINGIGFGHIKRAHNIIAALSGNEYVGKIHIASSSLSDFSAEGIDEVHQLSISPTQEWYQEYLETTYKELWNIIENHDISYVFHDTYFVPKIVQFKRHISHFYIYRLSSWEHFQEIKEYLPYFKKIFIPHTEYEFDMIIGLWEIESIRDIVEFVGYIYNDKIPQGPIQKWKILVAPWLGWDYLQTKEFLLHTQDILSQFSDSHEIHIYPGKHKEKLQTEISFLPSLQVHNFSTEWYIHDFATAEIFIGRAWYNSVGEVLYSRKKALHFPSLCIHEREDLRVDFFAQQFAFIRKGTFQRETDTMSLQYLLDQEFDTDTYSIPQSWAVKIALMVGEIFSRKNLLIFYPSYTQKSHGFIADELYELGKIYNLHICVFNRFFHGSPFMRNNHIILYKEFTDIFYVPDIFPNYSIFDETQKKNYALFLSYIKNYCQHNNIDSCMCEFLSDAVFIAPLKKIHTNIQIFSHCRGKDIYVHFWNFPEKLQKNTIASLDACFVRDSSMQSYAQGKSLPSPTIIRTGKNLENYSFSLKNIHPMRIILWGRFVEKKWIHNTLILLELLLKRWKVDIQDIFLLWEIEREEQSYGEKLKEIIYTSPLLSPKVKMLWFLDQKQYKKYIEEEANVFIGHFQKSKDGDEDGIPNVLSENMLVGNLVFSTLAWGIGDILIDSNTWYTLSGIQDKDVEKIETVFSTLWIWDFQIHKSARLKIEQDFNIYRQIEKLINILWGKKI